MATGEREKYSHTQKGRSMAGMFGLPLHYQILLTLCSAGWANESDGNVEAPTGYFWRISLSHSEIFGWPGGAKDCFADEIPNATDDDWKKIIGHWICAEDSNGFFYATRQDDEYSAQKVFADLTREFSEWDAD